MPSWLSDIYHRLTDLPLWAVALATGVSVVMFVGSLAVTAWALVRLPADYFCGPEPHGRWQDRHPAVRCALLIGRNLLGVVLILLGIVLSLPGVPGQGILTILLGVMLLSLPGKRRCEQWLVSRRRVRAGIDRIRARFGKPPLVLDGDPPA